jgi:N-acetylated-alpha-linked acidic dipeptidase
MLFRLKLSTAPALLAALVLSGAGPAPRADTAFLGFTTATVETERRLETEFLKLAASADLDGWSRRLSARPHHAGSPHNRDNVAFIAGLFREWGYTVAVEEYDILFPVPLERELELLQPVRFRAALAEAEVAGDASSAARAEVLPPFNAYSADGDVTGELVYVNYGAPEDYELLARYGIDVKDKIVIARYGKTWRGIKPREAAQHGAIGTIIYTDPAEDGYAQGDVYPAGPFKHATGVQRGSVMDITLYPGDAQTPGRAAVKNARRLPLDQTPTIMRIPVLPISYADAQPLLQALAGAVAPPEWRGALPITYHLGPGPARVRMKVKFDWRRIAIQNVIARWPGARQPDQWVIRGNHQDSWNHGASDPVSGLVAVMAEAQATAALARAGNPPARTLIYAAWDAEEPGLIGSTEWAEQHARALGEQTVAYINSDNNGRGFARIGGSHTLERFLNQVAAAVTDPQTGGSVLARARAAVTVYGDDKARADLAGRSDLRIAPLGSGSDYSPFLQHLGIASVNLGFSGESANGSYHTLYDTYEHYSRFQDPGFRYGTALAGMAGLAVLRLANAEVLPFRFSGLADNIKLYLEELQELAASQRKQADVRNQQLREGVFSLALDPLKPLQPPPPLPEVPYFNFAPLQNALSGVQEAARDLDAALDQLDPARLKPEELDELNRRLFQSERQLIRADGLPGRDWYRHQIYAPGFNTGYEVKTLPRVRENMEARRYDQVDAAISYTAAVMSDFVVYLKGVRALLSP